MFRAENPNIHMHLYDFIGLDVEMGIRSIISR
jgi:aspartyl/asparaginyl-tRNA synthetase